MSLAACKGQTTGASYDPVPVSQPIVLGSQAARVQSLQPSSASALPLPAINKRALSKALARYRINKRKKPGPVSHAAADLNGDGKAEVIAYFTGEDWCAETGCALAVFTTGAHGYVPVSTTQRVRSPILLGERSSNGWQNLHVKTGGATYGTRFVTLRFTGRGYPGNAITQTPLPKDVTPPGRVLIPAADPAIASTAPVPATAGSTSRAPDTTGGNPVPRGSFASP